MSSHDLIAEEYAPRIDREIEVPVLVGEVKGMAHRRDACIGDADLATAQKLERLVKRALDRRALPHVDLDDTTTEALIAKRMNRLMHFTELMLKDDTLPLWQTSAAANGASA